MKRHCQRQGKPGGVTPRTQGDRVTGAQHSEEQCDGRERTDRRGATSGTRRRGSSQVWQGSDLCTRVPSRLCSSESPRETVHVPGHKTSRLMRAWTCRRPSAEAGAPWVQPGGFKMY